ncbi:MAG: hypothetical protein ABI402_05925 [Ferruginibacter sp.]
MTKFILIIIVSILFYSCGQDENKRKELELKEKELALKQRELDLKEKESNILPSKDSISRLVTDQTTTPITPTSTSLSDDEIIKFIKKDFSKERNDEQFPSPSVGKVFLVDYNNDGLKDGVAYAVSYQERAKFSFNGFGLYKNENGKMRLMDWKVSGISNFESVQQSGNNVIVKALEIGPQDAQCCPSIKKTITLTFSNDKIKGLQ